MDLNALKTDIDGYLNGGDRIREDFDKWKESVNKEANILAREFDRKRQAWVSARAGNTLSGKLDTTRLAEYKLNDDLFQRTKILPVGKNHKFYVILDWSGSMGNIAFSAMKQTVIQAAFLRKLKIDHYITMFGYEGEGSAWDSEGKRDGDLFAADTHSIVLFHGGQSNVEYDISMKICFILGRTRSWDYPSKATYPILHEVMRGCSMGHTPLNSHIADMYNVMWADHVANPTVQQNLLLISDGDSSQLNAYGKWGKSSTISYQFEIDGKSKGFPPALLASDTCKHETYGLMSMFDWGVNKIFLFLGERTREYDVIDLVGRYLYYTHVESKFNEIKRGRILNLKNVFGCIDDVIYVGNCAKAQNAGDAEMPEDLPTDNKGGISLGKFKTEMSKQALGNPLQYLSAVLGEALAKNYSLNKHAMSSKQNARAITIGFDDKYWTRMEKFLDEKMEERNK
jgi:hypothetical protein